MVPKPDKRRVKIRNSRLLIQCFCVIVALQVVLAGTSATFEWAGFSVNECPFPHQNPLHIFEGALLEVLGLDSTGSVSRGEI